MLFKGAETPQRCSGLFGATHLGQRSWAPQRQAEHMTALTTECQITRNPLALRGPSTHEQPCGQA